MKLYIVVILSWLITVQPVLSCTSPVIDGHNTTGFVGGTTTQNLTLTTTGTNRIVLVHIATTSLTGSDPAISSVSDTAGLVWTRRGTRQTWTGTGTGTLTNVNDTFWAFSSGTLTADSISVTWSAAPPADVITVAGISGVTSMSIPFDSNGSLPAYASDSTGAGTAPTVVLSTSHSADLLIATCDSNGITNFCDPVASTSPAWVSVSSKSVSSSANALTTVLYVRATLPQLTGFSAAPSASSSTKYWQLNGDATIGDDSGCPGKGALLFQTPINYSGERPRPKVN